MPTADDGLIPVDETTDEDYILKPFVTLGLVPEDDDEVPSGPDEISQFDRRCREPFSGLLYLGKLDTIYKLYGHTFRLETPSQAEKLEAGVLHKPYVNSLSSDIAWATMTVAMYLKAVDGTPLPEPIGPRDSGIRDRFNWIIENVRPPIIAKLFEECLLLDHKVNTTLSELDRLGES